jgi:hypothetical protein
MNNVAGFQTTSTEVRKYLLREELLLETSSEQLPSAFVDDDDEATLASRQASRRPSFDLTGATPARHSPLASTSVAEALLSPKLAALAARDAAQSDGSGESTEVNDDADDLSTSPRSEQTHDDDDDDDGGDDDDDDERAPPLRRRSSGSKPIVAAPTPSQAALSGSHSGKRRKKKSTK